MLRSTLGITTIASCALTLFVGCGNTDSGGSAASGGSAGTSGSFVSGGSSSEGGSVAANGGSTNSGGGPANGASGSGGTSERGGSPGTGGASKGGTTGPADAASPDANGTAPSGDIETCFGDACPLGQCDNGRFYADVRCSDVYPGPVDQSSTFCGAGASGGYCLVVATTRLENWAFNCKNDGPHIAFCGDAACRVKSGTASCE